MKISELCQVHDALNDVLKLPHGKAPDVALWCKVMDARGVVQAEIHRAEYKATGKLPEVAA